MQGVIFLVFLRASVEWALLVIFFLVFCKLRSSILLRPYYFYVQMLGMCIVVLLGSHSNMATWGCALVWWPMDGCVLFNPRMVKRGFFVSRILCLVFETFKISNPLMPLLIQNLKDFNLHDKSSHFHAI